ncbi:MAG: heme ABC exporter ATP-binding protein CcmA [Verrucomicrobiae bacterium]|nr:heme ABC exporter ATP-binding protein CcmA [Verrucomicrobiae bacterium]
MPRRPWAGGRSFITRIAVNAEHQAAVTSPSQLVVTDLVVERGGRTVIAGLSFEVYAGEAVVVTGPNGAGKTTLMRALAGFLAPKSGTIELRHSASDVAGSTGDDPASIAEQAHVIGHLNGIKATLTVAENMAFARNYLASGRPPSGPSGTTSEDCIGAALDQLGLGNLAGIPAGLLSAGQKRRLCLGRLLVAQRQIWLLDEPTVSLDTLSTRLVATLVDQHVTSGGIAIIVTHVPLGLAAYRELELRTPTATAVLAECAPIAPGTAI